MLVLTPTAVAVVNNLTSAVGEEGAGLRISSHPDAPAPGLHVEIAAAPEADDQLVDSSGARVFLDPQAAMMLDDKVLDATVDEQGQASFVLGTQAAPGDADHPEA
ncbi:MULTISPECIES: hypothetical protein [Thermocrispum]|jgi:Fe-S cluster assembly iron-binding protein IscA|uniref:Iron-sulfur cluster biosynthesis protein n=1 Tax=Thermocrispum agreste TaxID=37925 RepID=A0ABD6FHH4_9PSEU|nr:MULTISPECIES: hypothetical protein [Thermocrispum]